MKTISLILCLIAIVNQSVMAMDRDNIIFIIEDIENNNTSRKKISRPDLLYYPEASTKITEENKSYVFDLGDCKFFYGSLQNVTHDSFLGLNFECITVNSSNIEQRAFSNIKGLKIVEINSDQPITINSNAFLDCPDLKEIIVKGKIASFQNSEEDDDGLNIIGINNFKIFSKQNVNTFNYVKKFNIFPAKTELHQRNENGEEEIIDM